ncbi:MAG: 50S ribosomal protein L19e [Candidatus Thermoplasmatota archaeon]|nr:50S ribosomal protein L19e [Candidatus Thermoplasmatota archaeon]
MNLKNQRRMAASLLKCGVNRVWIDPLRMEDVADAITRTDIRIQIDAGAIKAKQKIGISRGRTRYYRDQRKKGRGRGQGSRKGTSKARKPKKERWIQTIRPIRERLRELRDEGKIEVSTYRKFYLQAKGGVFKSKSHLETHLRSGGYLKEDE